MHVPVCIRKGGKGFVEEMVRHVLAQPKMSSSIHEWRCNLQLVMPVIYPKPTNHVQPTTNPPHELTKV